MPSPIKLITGLGNPGSEHSETRHNAGFWFVDLIAEKFAASFQADAKFFSYVCRIQHQDLDFWLCKPQTYMNESGKAVRAISTFYKIPVEEILIVHDEIDLDAGTIRLKQGGGHGGNNGLRDIIEQLGSKDFIRMRIGIGHPGTREHVTPHVLSKPSKEDRELIDQAIDKGLANISLVLQGELQKATTKLHSTEIKEQDNNNEQ